MARRSLAIGPWISWAEFDRNLRRALERFPHARRDPLLVPASIPAKILKIHTLERECRLRLHSKTVGSSEAKATAPKASATAKSFLILPSPATRKFSQTLLIQDRSLS